MQLRSDMYNENQVRAAAGVTMAAGTVAFCYAYFEHRFLPIKAVSVFFFFDFLIRVTTSLRFSPSGIISGLLVRHKPKDWVSAAPKQFAWSLGLAMSGATAIITNLNIHGWWPRSLCLVCITLMWMEAVLGLCLGCQLYAYGVSRGWISRRQGMVCADGVCAVPDLVGITAAAPRARVRPLQVERAAV